MDDLDAAFAAAESDAAARAIVLSCAGPSLCAGYDLSGSWDTTPPAERWSQANALTRLRDVEARQRNALCRIGKVLPYGKQRGET